MPRGRRPSTAALTRLGARKASEMVMLTCRTLHFSRMQSSVTLVTRPEITSSSHRRPRAMALTKRARRSNCSGHGVDGVKQSDLRHREPHSVFERFDLRLGIFACRSLEQDVVAGLRIKG